MMQPDRAEPCWKRRMDDDVLARHLAADLDRGFEAVVHAHQDRLYTIALRLLGEPRDAEEVAQDAFVRAYRAIASWERDRRLAVRLRPWLAPTSWAAWINSCSRSDSTLPRTIRT